MKVLIFGVCGFVGDYLVQEFTSNGYEVYGSDMVDIPRLLENIPYYKSDLLDSLSISQIVSDVNPDIIVNLAAISSVGASWNIPQQTISVNVIGALNILEAARIVNNNVKILFIGSSEEYKTIDRPIDEECELNANNPYGISKVTLEAFVNLYREKYGMNIYYVRPFNHTGIGQKDSFVIPSWCKQVAEIEKSGVPGKICVGNISVKRDFSHVKDIVRAYRMIIEGDNCRRVYNVGSGIAYELKEILSFIISLCSQKIDIEIEQNRVRPNDNSVICCDNELIRAEIGWEPRYNVFDSVKELYEYYLNN